VSSYFDKFDLILRAVDLESPYITEDLSQLEERLVQEVSLCGEHPYFPPDLKAQLHQIILGHDVSAIGRQLGTSVTEPPEDHLKRIRHMSTDLHTLFHALAQRGIRGLTDNPLSFLQYLKTQASEYRNHLHLAGQGSTCPECGRALVFRPVSYRSPWIGDTFYDVEVHAWLCEKGCIGALFTEPQRREYDRLLGFEILRENHLSLGMIDFILSKSLHSSWEVLGNLPLPSENENTDNPELKKHLLNLLVGKEQL